MFEQSNNLLFDSVKTEVKGIDNKFKKYTIAFIFVFVVDQ